MKLKEIKPGMVIHCKTNEEAEKLIEFTKSLHEFFGSWFVNENETCYRMEDGKIVGFSRVGYYKTKGHECVEFSDLIEPELSAEEALQIISEICTGRRCTDCPIGTGNCVTNKLSDKHKVVEICQQWKSDHEKKEPEIEWVYRVFGAENFGEKFFETEEEAIERCEELAKSQKTKKYARYERVCRVKEQIWENT